MIVKHETTETKGAFIALEDNKKIGEMVYSSAGNDKIIIEHTEVHPDEKGKGVGRVLLDKAVEYARDNEIKIVPLCPYAKSMFDRDVNIRDVLG
ncbi:N-acetyltransferase [Sphingobacterium sp. SGG-5]|uniref:GNAT family N-acetyltransferase n=1 Tax=Sphingobacterium sp. SGG-5 TaxID=2710881 RepID=UPI0013ED4229|nr:GNAT family N-acetyltransferase [Sphingobacterium sp. SGG-5]NGM62043.1 N-acetyltransferase [Sphingobacterium sp. SGG-5]